VSQKTFNILWHNVSQEVQSEVQLAMQSLLGRINFLSSAPTDLATDAVIMDFRGIDPIEATALLTKYADCAFVITEHQDIDNINNILAKFPVSHVFGTNGKNIAREIAISLKKLVTGDIWGLDKYFESSKNLQSRIVKGAAEINGVIDELLKTLDVSETFETAREFLRMTANELTTNAVYNAPVDTENNPKYEQTDRKIKVVLLDSESVEISFCYDDQYVGIAVTDNFGRLTRDKIVRHLVKCVNNTKFVENKKGGAGAGIYLAYYVSNQFIINLDEGKKLEAICILEKSKRYKEYRSRITSFNYFKKFGGAA
jgi:sigma-B regulation protein RsbU (phosphoserine phosphatase)